MTPDRYIPICGDIRCALPHHQRPRAFAAPRPVPGYLAPRRERTGAPRTVAPFGGRVTGPFPLVGVGSGLGHPSAEPLWRVIAALIAAVFLAGMVVLGGWGVVTLLFVQ